MFIDQLLSRLSVQAKVLVLLVPLIASITAVGVTGLWASGILQSRIELSNGVLRSLTGFRDLSSSMSRFIANTTTAGLDEVKRQVAEQRNTLAMMRDQIPEGSQDASELEHAEKTVADTGNYVDSLWSLNETKIDLETTIQKGLSVVVASRTTIGEALKKVQRSVQDEDTAAKGLLREVGSIRSTQAFLTETAAAFAKASDAEGRRSVVTRMLPDMKKRLRIVAMSLEDVDRPIIKSLEADRVKLETTSGLANTPDEVTAALGEAIGRFEGAAKALEPVAERKLNSAVGRFGDLNARADKAAAVLTDGRQLLTSGYSLQIIMARFLLQPTIENQARLKQEFVSMRKDLAKLKLNAAGTSFYGELEQRLSPALDTTEEASAKLVEVSQERMMSFTRAGDELDKAWAQLASFAERQKQGAGEDRRDANVLSLGTTVLGVVVSVFAGIGLVLTFKGPISQITTAMRRLAEGSLDTKISGEHRLDEIGDMARALGVFKENALSKRDIEQASAVQRLEVESERQRNEDEKRAIDLQIAFAVDTLAAGLERLANGDISRPIETAFQGRLEQLRTDFNRSLERLQTTIRQVRENTALIQSNAAEMSAAADNLAKRTEQQAASLEETAAAVEQVTVTVKASAAQTQEVNHIVLKTKNSAEASVSVVHKAVTAMGRIEDASSEIVHIIDVIDEIAFQTNLLALNAGIEAARAGESGRGFAVVAQEVRELAQRSAGAARQIKGLIDKSRREVTVGAELVQQAGSVLSAISGDIVTVVGRIGLIATAAQDQSGALSGVNASINDMDQMTQRNAAMVEETNAATRLLADEAATLMQIVNAFKLPETADDIFERRNYAA
ncbi:methyl-accepting chemotaxis protein [Rhizobium sp. DKSPLA3]|uniref:Methyl-accepting chemotaxis protein n=1 Tax=Rhizobium quercicola TaxID=2901226 RepID=A0A9X1T315_9HYPH|nr:methyl-accepting chemotaxis protein [Rhizobium quercicola]MCD7111475.1 methyl-accepting chemotaxis protein [Rhizobium quercicola]